ncbi:MAG: ferritin [Candidatus Omnitrophica bacterium]|nr:ferritin [Candidatus Omnitrophota bacterium]
MDNKVSSLLNDQVTKEFDSAYVYLAMAAYFESKGLSGMASWMQVQYGEEMKHGMKFFGYLNARGIKVSLGALPKPVADFGSVREVFEKSLAHEKLITASINKIYETAMEVNDHATTTFLQWFISEQVEEEKTAKDILVKLDQINDSSMGLIFLDKELGSRK